MLKLPAKASRGECRDSTSRPNAEKTRPFAQVSRKGCHASAATAPHGLQAMTSSSHDSAASRGDTVARSRRGSKMDLPAETETLARSASALWH